MEAERYVSHVIGPKTATVTGETTPTDTIIRVIGICSGKRSIHTPV